MCSSMGILFSCCLKDKEEDSPSYEERRQRMLEAAEQRQKNEQCRGIADIQSVKRLQQRAKAVEDASNELDSQGSLRWQID